MKFIYAFFIGIWDFIFFFFGMPYEEQAKKLKLDENDGLIRGPDNVKRSTKVYRPNKVSNNKETDDS